MTKRKRRRGQERGGWGRGVGSWISCDRDSEEEPVRERQVSDGANKERRR